MFWRLCMSVPGPHIYIVGSSLIYWAAMTERRANVQARHQLHGAAIHWVGRRGAGVAGFMDLLDVVQSRGYPALVVLHLGANDIGSRSNVDISGSLLSMRRAVLQAYPGCEVALSELVFRTHYRGGGDASAMDRCRRRINTDLHRYAPGWVVLHRNLDGTDGLLRDDGVHLTDIGNCLLINNIFKFLIKLF